MTNAEIKNILDLTQMLNTDYDSKTVACANMNLQFCDDPVFEDQLANLTIMADHVYVILADKIYDKMTVVDEPRYSLYDYADAVIHASRRISLEKLVNLDDDAFVIAMIWLATDKRETYCDQSHEQEPLEFDIWE